jgi:AraC-like DNA-binding protein
MPARDTKQVGVSESDEDGCMTDAQIRKMRFLREYNPQHWTYKQLAAEFKCGESTVRDIIKHWTRWSA